MPEIEERSPAHENQEQSAFESEQSPEPGVEGQPQATALPNPVTATSAVPGLSASPSQASSHEHATSPPVDPAEWSPMLSDLERTDLVSRGPLLVSESFTYPKKPDGRSFHYHYTYRQLVNGEKIKRSWQTYSKKTDAVYCFCCKFFSRKSAKLATEGLRDWVNVGVLLKQHENSTDHSNNLVKFKEFSLRLFKGKTIDATEMALLEGENS